jgi:uncharacterized radical SAM superfamily protein
MHALVMSSCIKGSNKVSLPRTREEKGMASKILTGMASGVAIFMATTCAAADYTDIEVQVAVDDYLSEIMIDNKINFLDFEKLSPVQSVPVEAHPLVFRGDGYYVACVTVIDSAGSEYPVDLYLFENEGELVVGHVTFGIEGREAFRRLAKSGAVERM